MKLKWSSLFSSRAVFVASFLVAQGMVYADTLALTKSMQGEDKPLNRIWMKTKSASGDDICQPWGAICEQSTCTSCTVKYLVGAEREKRKLSYDLKTKTWLDANGVPYDTAKENEKYGSEEVITRYDQKASEAWGIVPGIWVIDTQGNFYTSVEHAPGKFHHSSFLAGGLVEGAGQVVFEDGKITHINNASGHYKPDRKSFLDAVKLLHIEDQSIVEFAAESGWSDTATKVRQSALKKSSLQEAAEEAADDGGYLEAN